MTTPAQPDPKWKRFEKIIHAMHQQLAPAGAIVTPDDIAAIVSSNPSGPGVTSTAHALAGPPSVALCLTILGAALFVLHELVTVLLWFGATAVLTRMIE